MKSRLARTAETAAQMSLGVAKLLIAINLAASLFLLVLLIGYGTDASKAHLLTAASIAVAVLLVVTGGAVATGLAVSGRQRRTLRPIALSLQRMAGSVDWRETLDGFEAFPSQANMPPEACGWNKLLSAVDELHRQGRCAQGQQNLGQLLTTYDSQKLLGLFDALPDGVILADPAGSILLANRACEGKMGMSLGQLVGGTVLELFEQDSAVATIQAVLDGKTSRQDRHFEVTVTPQSHTSGQMSSENVPVASTSGAQGPVEASATVLHVRCHRLTDDAENSDILLILRDITQRKVSQASQSDFIAHVSHELRSPLTNIRAYAETLLSDMVLDAGAQKEAFNVINTETARLIRLVNDVLDLSRMETGSLSLDIGPVVLDRLISQCVSDVKALAHGKKITLQTNYHPKLPNIMADREKLTVGLNNVLSNAIKYTPEAGTIFVETNLDDDYIYIKVSDTGYGIAPADIDRIFERFYRIDRAETAHIEGTGLGLATTKEIVALHGGAVDVVSELNKGTEFTIKLPYRPMGPVLGTTISQDAKPTDDVKE